MDWIASFEKWLEPRRTGDLFRRWAAVYTFASALQRRVWVRSDGDRIYPNLFIILCGESAAGKGVALAPVRQMLLRVDKQYVAPSSLTPAALIDALQEGEVSIFSPNGDTMSCNAVTIVSPEMGVLLPEYSNLMIQRLTDLYDNLGYSEQTRGRGLIELPNAHLSLIAGTTPAYMAKFLPEGAWEEGFMSRVITVYGSPTARRGMNPNGETGDSELWKELITTLNQRLEYIGEIEWTPEAIAAYDQWYVEDEGQPAPSHPKLKTYCSRRHFNLLKLLTVFARSRDSQFIEVCDVDRALTLLQDTELHIEDVFKAIQTGGAESIMRDLWHHVMKLHVKGSAPVRRSLIVSFLYSRVPIHQVDWYVKAMVDGGLLKEETIAKIGPAYTPLNPS